MTHWPDLTSENRPWARWWWLGSALTEGGITRSLERFHETGFGGVEISPIYGVSGYEARFVTYLSEKWTDLLSHTLHEAARLGMSVDMIVGTGWPFGGPWVSDDDSPRKLVWKTHPAGQPADWLAGVTPLGESAPDAAGNVLAAGLARTGQAVKRAAPGGEGNVLDHFSAGASRRYFQAFDAPLDRLPKGGPALRCLFNDSYEVFGATATPGIFEEFTRRRGYDIRAHLHELRGGAGVDRTALAHIRADYRQTIEEMFYHGFVAEWNAWAHGRGGKTRFQAHGSPGNLLDFYAAADIPETEIFGPPRLALGGLRPVRGPLPPDFGTEGEPLICRMASSAAHVAGKPLCSSESFTWLGEHGCVPLEHAKAEVDTLFALGINHIFFHGSPFSPDDVPWPGWLFYATTHCAPTNTWWRDLSALNAYIARCQSLLQAGAPDADFLLYFPYSDIQAGGHGATEREREAGLDILQFLTVHKTGNWMRGNVPEFVSTANDLQHGWSFDMVSDRQLVNDIEVNGSGELAAKQGGTRWPALLVVGCRIMPPETMERIAALAHAGAAILFAGPPPDDVPGFADRDARLARLHSAWSALKATGRLRTTGDPLSLLAQAGVRQEPIAAAGLEFTRRRTESGGYVYFIANPGQKDVSGWFALMRPSAIERTHPSPLGLLDAMTGRTGTTKSRLNADGHTEVFLDVPAGASLFLTGDPAKNLSALSPWVDYATAGPGMALHGEWSVAFAEGGPTLPAARTLKAISDWTTWQDDSDVLRAFSGTAHYTLTFDAPPGRPPDAWSLDLGVVCHSARVRVNGRDAGTLLARPWRVTLSTPLHAKGNVLEIEVTNLMANRLINLEKTHGAAWRPFYLVDINYKPFTNAAGWEPVPSGLIGPVRLTPLKVRELT